jgi:hypothetical protein
MLAAGAIVGISVGLAFLAGVAGLIIHNRYAWRRYRANHADGKGKDPERVENGGVLAVRTDEEFRRRELAGMGVDPDQQQDSVELGAVPPHGEYGYSLDAMVEGHNDPQRAVYAGGVDAREYSNGGPASAVEQQQRDDEIRPVPGPSYSPTSFAQRQATMVHSPVRHSPAPQTPPSRSPVSGSPVNGSPAAGSPPRSLISRSPISRSPASRSPVARSAGSPIYHHPQDAVSPPPPPPDDLRDVGRAF